MGTCLWSAVFFVAAMIGGPQRSPLRFNEMHHEYVGQVMCLAGAALHSHLLEGLGGVLAADDAVQHIYQRANGNLGIESPLDMAYQRTLGRLPPFMRLDRFFDRTLH